MQVWVALSASSVASAATKVKSPDARFPSEHRRLDGSPYGIRAFGRAAVIASAAQTTECLRHSSSSVALKLLDSRPARFRLPPTPVTCLWPPGDGTGGWIGSFYESSLCDSFVLYLGGRGLEGMPINLFLLLLARFLLRGSTQEIPAEHLPAFPLSAGVCAWLLLSFR